MAWEDEERSLLEDIDRDEGNYYSNPSAWNTVGYNTYDAPYSSSEPVDYWSNVGSPGGYNPEEGKRIWKEYDAYKALQDKNSYNNRVTGYPTVVSSRGTGYGRSAYSTAKSIAEKPSIMSTPLYGSTYLANQMPSLTYTTFTAPERNQQRVRSLAQENAAQGLGKLSRKTDSAILKAYNIDGAQRGLTLRQALSGYGEGIGNITSAARKSAESQYEREYGDKMTEAKMNWEAENRKRQAEYEAELKRIWAMA